MKNILLAIAACAAFGASATIVEIQTNKGNIEVNLFDEATPETVANFLRYVNSGSYNNSIIHRSVANFVIQGGGYVYDNTSTLSTVVSDDPVVNEPVYSNVRGTIAVAKVGGNPNSGTSQWFFNTENNSQSLDAQNGGFTVFGQVTSGLDVVDDIAALPIFDFGGALSELPLDNYTDTDYSGDPDNNVDPTTPDDNNLVIIYQVVVTNANSDTASGLNPTENTLIDDLVDQPAPTSDSSSTLAYIILWLFGVFLVRRRA